MKNIIERYRQLDDAIDRLTDRRDDIEKQLDQRIMAYYREQRAGKPHYGMSDRPPRQKFCFYDVPMTPEMVRVTGEFFFSDGETCPGEIILPRDYLLGENPSLIDAMKAANAERARQAQLADEQRRIDKEAAERAEYERLKEKFG